MQVESENEYEDLLGQWSDLESGLSTVLNHPESTEEFPERIAQYDRWIQSLMEQDYDMGLYLLFQLASNSPVGYSASHALVCGVLCHLLAAELQIIPEERDSLVRAALTMNIGMTALQDELANQTEKPNPKQQAAIRAHPIKGAMILAGKGILEDNWLDIVTLHHDESVERTDLPVVSPAIRLSRILKAVDRYAAMISPRVSRAARSAAVSARTLMGQNNTKTDELGQALLKTVGLYPPGTYVRLDTGELAVVVRRSGIPDQPYVAILGQSSEELYQAPVLHCTAEGKPHIRNALPASSAHNQPHHFKILNLSAKIPQPA
jgi:HD-GYP domain-containing protein (c-di-GMP phosphodiesterase class II)